jgi:hypothetical protein
MIRNKRPENGRDGFPHTIADGRGEASVSVATTTAANAYGSHTRIDRP